jgi:very-short-patch-repair endonuclease
METKYNETFWKDVQIYYDEGYTIRECIEKYKFSWCAQSNAKNKGWFNPRTIGKSKKIHNKKYGVYTHTEETKLKMSIQRKQYLKEHPDKIPYKLNHYSKRTSYAETYFIEVIEKENIQLKHHLQIGLYELDFYNEELKIYFEVDGDQHYLDKRIYESDLKRNQYLSELGWRGMRLRWSTYKKLQIEQRLLIIQQIKSHIVNNDLSLSCLQII